MMFPREYSLKLQTLSGQEQILKGDVCIHVRHLVTGSAAPHSRWWDATFHVVTGVVGVGVLSLPYAFSYLTWTGGVIALAVTTATSFYTGYLLAALHEDKDGRRHNRYR